MTCHVKAASPSPSNYHMSIVSQIVVGFCAHFLPSILRSCLASTCANLGHAAPVVLSLYMQLSCHVYKTVFACNDSLPPVCKIFLPFLPQSSLNPGVGVCFTHAICGWTSHSVLLSACWPFEGLCVVIDCKEKLLWWGLILLYEYGKKLFRVTFVLCPLSRITVVGLPLGLIT